MTGPRPGKGQGVFGADELADLDGIGPDELAAEVRLGRDLQGTADRTAVRSSAGFSDRVMAAVATEPLPAPAVAAGSALRRGAVGGFLLSIRDAFRVTFGAGFPVVARAQALAVVLLVTIVATGSGFATAGALGALTGTPSPSPSLPAPTVQPTQTAEPSPSPSPSPEISTPSPEDTLAPAVTATPHPEKTDGGDGTEAPDDNGKETGASAPKPTERSTPAPVATPHPTEDDHHETPEPTGTRHRESSPEPTSTPHDD